MQFVTIFFLIYLFNLVFSQEIITLTDSNIDNLQKGTWFVKFYAPWCGHCTRMQPAFKQLAQEMGGSVNIAEVDCTVQKDSAARFGIRGYPTLKLFVNGQVIPYESSERTVDAMKAFITGMTYFLKVTLCLTLFNFS